MKKKANNKKNEIKYFNKKLYSINDFVVLKTLFIKTYNLTFYNVQNQLKRLKLLNEKLKTIDKNKSIDFNVLTNQDIAVFSPLSLYFIKGRWDEINLNDLFIADNIEPEHKEMLVKTKPLNSIIILTRQSKKDNTEIDNDKTNTKKLIYYKCLLISNGFIDTIDPN